LMLRATAYAVFVILGQGLMQVKQWFCGIGPE
jgi:hypothetical protein